ncbi:hypothetical protein [Actinomadura chokoriensis]|uniref:hypothetical protein n=1 Tax=Actinomadura chokoriensis TaxID=454156 RepID=UPI0031F9C6DB
MSSPHPAATTGFYDDLPADVARLAEITRGLMIHRVGDDLGWLSVAGQDDA